MCQQAPQTKFRDMEIEKYIVATDAELIDMARGGDAEAFGCLFNRYRDSIYQLYRQRTSGQGVDIDDLLQETFVKVYLNLNKYNASYTFGQWVYTIARNTFIDYTRKKRENMVSIDGTPEGYREVVTTSGTLNPEERLITDQGQAQLERFIGQMSPRYRTLIDLRFFRDYTYEEIAAELKLPLGTVKTQIHRAREQLCRFIQSSSENMM